ncbi:hypothetical protein FRC02_001677 [Tulasnella sp. 418]|nr:hypothetical protein FRC02_001677 [Tulasnella sp. 418]
MKPSTQPGSPRTVKVAVIGSGLAGLTAAYGLSTQNGKVRTRDGELLEFEVHLFEKADQLGMDASSVSIDQGDTQKFRTDVPMRSFQGGKSALSRFHPTGLIITHHHLSLRILSQSDIIIQAPRSQVSSC